MTFRETPQTERELVESSVKVIERRIREAVAAANVLGRSKNPQTDEEVGEAITSAISEVYTLTARLRSPASPAAPTEGK